jgi:hypothetical protein
MTAVTGSGTQGMLRGYPWLLSGSDDVIKPDHMVIRWHARHGEQADTVRASRVVSEVAQELTLRLGRPVTS